MAAQFGAVQARFSAARWTGVCPENLISSFGRPCRAGGEAEDPKLRKPVAYGLLLLLRLGRILYIDLAAPAGPSAGLAGQERRWMG